MARGVTTLETLVQDLRLETRRSPNTNIGQDEYQTLKRLLYRTQYFLYWDYDWPFLRARGDITLAQDQRYYDFQDDSANTINFDRILTVRANGNNAWKRIPRGITMEQYEIYDSDNSETAYPVERWDVINTGSGEQLEVWPMPSQNSETLRIEHIKPLGAFTADTDTCTLDDTLIVLFAAADLLTGQDDKLAQNKLSAANKLYLRMRGGAQRREGGFFIPGSRMPGVDHYAAPRVLAVKDES